MASDVLEQKGGGWLSPPATWCLIVSASFSRGIRAHPRLPSFLSPSFLSNPWGCRWQAGVSKTQALLPEAGTRLMCQMESVKKGLDAVLTAVMACKLRSPGLDSLADKTRACRLFCTLAAEHRQNAPTDHSWRRASMLPLPCSHAWSFPRQGMNTRSSSGPTNAIPLPWTKSSDVSNP